ncbi:hypothetical protein MOQ_003557 [Trypanosoma cruzi marinkellei]|uniref:PDZ domain-containing protein n=1 Tax=Trypanosoma cruzi marinkellei TaxID=85056 RepID=K2NUG9_TRYCR|nr:hypothetical protein MOQ_003557 [Trypanosoma cruzi marinkellei]
MLNVRRLIFFALLFLHGAVSDTGAFPRRCHIDSNRFLAKSISRGEWIGIAYNITYLKGMCDTDDRNGMFIASINRQNKSLKAREGFIAFDNVATVHFNLTSGKKGVQLFSSQICWSSTNCTALCSFEPLGIVSKCTVGNIMDSLAIFLFFVLPLFVCSFALLVCYARVKLLRRRGMLAFRERHRQEDISPAAGFEKSRKPRYDESADINPTNSVDTAVFEMTMVQDDGETTTREAEDMNDSARRNSIKKDITNECELKPYEVFFLRENNNNCENEKLSGLKQDNVNQTTVDITKDIKKNGNYALQYTYFRSTASPYNCNAREKTKRESTEAARNALELKEEYVQHGVAEEEAARRMHEVAEEEASRRMHEVAEEEAARRMHEVAEEEAARRMHEVAEEEAARRVHEMAEEEAARRVHEVAEEEAARRVHEVEGSRTVVEADEEMNNPGIQMPEDVAWATGGWESVVDVEEISTSDDDVFSFEGVERVGALGSFVGVEQNLRGCIELDDRRLESDAAECKTVYERCSAVCSVSSWDVMPVDEEEEAWQGLVESEESQRESIVAVLEEWRLLAKSRFGTTEEERILSASRSYSDEYRWRMLKMVKPPSDTQPPKPFIGFSLAEFLVESFLKVDGLYVNGPAYQVGIRIDDILLGIEGERVTSITEARKAVSRHCRVGYLTDLTLQRSDGAVYTVSLWVMTAEPRFKEEPYFFDVSQHNFIQRHRETNMIEGTPNK